MDTTTEHLTPLVLHLRGNNVILFLDFTRERYNAKLVPKFKGGKYKVEQQNTSPYTLNMRVCCLYFINEKL